MPEFTTLIHVLSFTDCPRWHNGRVSDFYSHRVLAVAMDGTTETVAHVVRRSGTLHGARALRTLGGSPHACRLRVFLSRS